MTDRRVRPGVKRRLCVVFAHLLADRPKPVHTEYTWNGKDTVSRNTLWLGVTEGDTDPESIGNGKRLETDDFVIPCNLRLLGFTDPMVAEQDAMDVVNTLAIGLAAAHRLRDVEGLADDAGGVATELYDGIAVVQIGPMDGPGHTLRGAGAGNLIQAWASFDLLCQSNLDFD